MLNVGRWTLPNMNIFKGAVLFPNPEDTFARQVGKIDFTFHSIGVAKPQFVFGQGLYINQLEHAASLFCPVFANPAW